MAPTGLAGDKLSPHGARSDRLAVHRQSVTLDRPLLARNEALGGFDQFVGFFSPTVERALGRPQFDHGLVFFNILCRSSTSASPRLGLIGDGGLALVKFGHHIRYAHGRGNRLFFLGL